MTEYRTTRTAISSISLAVKAAKAKRQAVLQRVKVQRVKAYKKTVAEWIQAEVIIHGNELK